MAAFQRHRIGLARARLKFALSILVATFFPLLAFADWRTDLTPLKPGAFPLPKPLTADYRFGWLGVTAGKAKVQFHALSGGKVELSATANSVGFARSLWKLDAKHDAFANARTLRPINLEQTEAYAAKTMKTKARFSDQEVWCLKTVDPPDKNRPKPKRFKLPEAFDLQSALLFARSQPLKPGETISMVVFPSSSPYLAIIKVLSKEDLTVRAGKFHTLKCDLQLFEIDKKLELHPHPLFKHGTIWVSDDQDRMLLKVQVDIFIGSVWVELEHVIFKSPAR
jgi:G:T/U-mismatch repair DNA glycosylase